MRQLLRTRPVTGGGRITAGATAVPGRLGAQSQGVLGDGVHFAEGTSTPWRGDTTVLDKRLTDAKFDADRCRPGPTSESLTVPGLDVGLAENALSNINL